ncbi:MAG TPA: hypothetical protein VG842_10755 [Sediminibacterium sp.]|nr:hypothetical protein [Sediminibacterium sp.]
MIRFFMAGMAALVGYTAQAQTESIKLSRLSLKHRPAMDTLPVVGKPADAMVFGLSNPLVFSGNNGHGMDIYRSRIDQMPVLKPDSSFHSNIAVGRKYGIRIMPLNPAPKPPAEK